MIDWLDCGLAVLAVVIGAVWWHWNDDVNKTGK